MRPSAIRSEIEACLSEFKYGVKPNSSEILSLPSEETDFRDENGSKVTAEFKLVLLEEIELRIKLCDLGFMITHVQPTPEYRPDTNKSDPVQKVKDLKGTQFEAIDSLLMSCSDMYKEKFGNFLTKKLMLLEKEQNKGIQPWAMNSS
ncbi:hypothetical protein BKA69DRAFT_1100644 [Paraphysoderma sedebokerense]|nr:hypothetical protein BKA69DRAFT_1100644 [Paraphysoderma sedebokerense]